MINLFKHINSTLLFATLLCCKTQAQVVLDANGPGQTYELINSKLAPGYTAVEAPDQCTSHPSFGRHIAEVWDATLNKYVFEFYIHVPTSFPVTSTTADNDRCVNFDRQRVEIKTYDQSPANLIGTVGETVNYKWQFRLPLGFQPSPNFSHIHQVKAVDGDDEQPLFTLTVRAGSPNIMQLLYVKDSSTSQIELARINLSTVAGEWVEVNEIVTVGANGMHSFHLKRLSDNAVLINTSNSNISTIRPSNSFIRPKWGIYRSLNSHTYLRDDSIRIAGISIQEGVLPVTLKNFIASIANKKTLLQWNVENEINFKQYEIEHSNNGKDFKTIAKVAASQQKQYSYQTENTDAKQYYRLKLVNNDGSFSYSEVITFNIKPSTLNLKLYPNPVKDFITIEANGNINKEMVITNANGGVVKKIITKTNVTTIATNDLTNGLYFLNIYQKNQPTETYKFSVVK